MDGFKSFVLGRRIGNSPPPTFLAIRSSKLFIMITICLAVFTDIFLYGVIVPVIPFAISTRAKVPAEDVQYWVSVLLAVYGGALLVTSPIAGWYADQSSSRREPLLFGLISLAGATVMLGLARNVGLLVAGRVLQGISAGIVWTVGQALLVDTAGQKDIGQTMGYMSISMSIGILIAPLLGGVVYERAGYYAVYYMCFGLIALDILLRLAMVERKIAAQWTDTSEEESRVGTAEAEDPAVEQSADAEADEKKVESGMTDSELPPDNSRSEASPSLSKHSLDATTNGNTGSSSNAAPDSPSPAPKPRRRVSLPPIITLLASRRLLAALWGCFVQASLMTAFDTVLPLFVADTFHWNSTGAGLVFLAIFIPNFAAPLAGWASDKYGSRWLAMSGFLLAVPFWVCLRFVTHNSMGQKVLLCALLALLGASLTIAMTPLMAEITYVVEAKERRNPGSFGATGAYAQAYGLFVMAFAAGTMIGPLWSGMVVEKAGWGTMTWSLAILSLAGAVPVLIWTGGLITRDNAKSGEERAAGRPLKRGEGTAEKPAVEV